MLHQRCDRRSEGQHGRDDFAALCVTVVAFARDVAFLVLEDLLFDLVNHGGNRGVHIRRHLLAVKKVLASLDVHFRDVTLVLFNREDEMRLQDLVNNSS